MCIVDCALSDPPLSSGGCKVTVNKTVYSNNFLMFSLLAQQVWEKVKVTETFSQKEGENMLYGKLLHLFSVFLSICRTFIGLFYMGNDHLRWRYLPSLILFTQMSDASDKLPKNFRGLQEIFRGGKDHHLHRMLQPSRICIYFPVKFKTVGPLF